LITGEASCWAKDDTIYHSAASSADKKKANSTQGRGWRKPLQGAHQISNRLFARDSSTTAFFLHDKSDRTTRSSQRENIRADDGKLLDGEADFDFHHLVAMNAGQVVMVIIDLRRAIKRLNSILEDAILGGGLIRPEKLTGVIEMLRKNKKMESQGQD